MPIRAMVSGIQSSHVFSSCQLLVHLLLVRTRRSEHTRLGLGCSSVHAYSKQFMSRTQEEDKLSHFLGLTTQTTDDACEGLSCFPAFFVHHSLALLDRASNLLSVMVAVDVCCVASDMCLLNDRKEQMVTLATLRR